MRSCRSWSVGLSLGVPPLSPRTIHGIAHLQWDRLVRGVAPEPFPLQGLQCARVYDAYVAQVLGAKRDAWSHEALASIQAASFLHDALAVYRRDLDIVTALLARMAGPAPYDAEVFSEHLSEHLRRLGAALASFEGAVAMIDARISVVTAAMHAKLPGATAEDKAMARQLMEEARLKSEGSIFRDPAARKRHQELQRQQAAANQAALAKAVAVRYYAPQRNSLSVGVDVSPSTSPHQGQKGVAGNKK